MANFFTVLLIKRLADQTMLARENLCSSMRAVFNIWESVCRDTCFYVLWLHHKRTFKKLDLQKKDKFQQISRRSLVVFEMIVLMNVVGNKWIDWFQIGLFAFFSFFTYKILIWMHFFNFFHRLCIRHICQSPKCFECNQTNASQWNNGWLQFASCGQVCRHAKRQTATIDSAVAVATASRY